MNKRRTFITGNLTVGGLRAADESFYSAEIARLERLARIIGGLDRS